jgi:rare lipoprotein A
MNTRWIKRCGAWAAVLMLAGCASMPGDRITADASDGGRNYPLSLQDAGPAAGASDTTGEFGLFSGEGETRGALAGPSLSQELPWTPPAPDVSNFRQTGSASWYGKKFAGHRTASGERYDMFAMTAAHRSLPMSAYVKVTNPANGKSVVVRINDRGPFRGHRIIDLSLAAATALDLQDSGTGRVEIQGLSSSQARAVAQDDTVASRK